MSEIELSYGKLFTTPILVKPASELPDCADVTLYVDPSTQKRYVRWMAGDETDSQPPTVVYYAPSWVWSLYQQALGKKN